MNGLSEKLELLESRLQSLIEGHLARLIPTRAFQDELIQKLVAAMKSGSKILPDGTMFAPDTYILFIHPDQLLRLSALEKSLPGLSSIIKDVGDKLGFIFSKHPEINLVPNVALDLKKVLVQAQISFDILGETVELSTATGEKASNIPLNAFLIVNGVKIFPLEKTVINIGRQSDNDLVINDPSVSRVHAQLRAVRGKYVISDLGSTDGTRVNGQRITQRTLHSKDVITLASIPMVYGQDDEGVGQTQEIDIAQDSKNPGGEDK